MSDELPPIEEVAELTEEEIALKKKLSKRLTTAEYEEAKLLYQKQGKSVEEIAKHVGISRGSLGRRFKRDKIVKNSLANLERQQVEQQMRRSASQNALEMINRGEVIRELALKGIDQGVRLAIKTQTDAIRNGEPISTTEKEQKAINNFLSNMEKSLVLATKVVTDYEDLDDTNLPVLEIVSMSDDDVERLRNEQAETDELLDELDVFGEENPLDEDDDDNTVVELIE